MNGNANRGELDRSAESRHSRATDRRMAQIVSSRRSPLLTNRVLVELVGRGVCLLLYRLLSPQLRSGVRVGWIDLNDLP